MQHKAIDCQKIEVAPVVNMVLSIANTSLKLQIKNKAEIPGELKYLMRFQRPILEGEYIDIYIVCSLVSNGENSSRKHTISFTDDNTIEIIDVHYEGTIVRMDLQIKAEFILDPSKPQELGRLLRACLSFICEERNEMLFHASGVLREGKLWLFSGRSGSGKTTIATLLNGGGEPFSVDFVTLSKGANGVLEAYPTPFGEGKESIEGQLEPQPVSGIFFLKQSNQNDLMKLEQDKASLMLLQQTQAFSRDVARVSSLLEMTGHVAQICPMFMLKFKFENTFWDLIDLL